MGCALALSLMGCSQKSPEPANMADARAMMAEHVQPTAEIYWHAVQYISDEQGSREIVPQNDAEWIQTAEAARKLKELGEELKKPEYAASRGTDWKDYAQGLSDAAGQAEQAAKAHSPEKVLEAGGTLYNVCSACHEVYMPAPAGPAPTDQSKSTPGK